MTSPILRILGALAGMGSAILCWFLGGAVAGPLRQGTLLALDGAHYALLAFLLVPALILAVVALFWVPPESPAEVRFPKEGSGDWRWCCSSWLRWRWEWCAELLLRAL